MTARAASCKASSKSGEDDTADTIEWQCSVCMNGFTRPKLLPCSHTFCQECLDGIVRNRPDYDRKRFPCPVCREMIQIPKNGVADFKNNIYISPKATPSKSEASGSKENELEIVLCKNHPEAEKRQIELLCLQCDVCLCWKCKNTHHLSHETEELTAAAERVKAKITVDKNMLKADISKMKKQMESCRKEHEDLRCKRQAVRKSIENRYNLLIAMADRFREEALFSLDTVTASIESQLPKDDLEKTMADLERLHQCMETCVSGKDASTLVTAALKIYSDVAAQKEAVQKVQAACSDTNRMVSSPTLNFSISADLCGKVCRNFIGIVVQKDWPRIAPVVEVREQIQCIKGKKRDIFSLMATADKVYVSYEKSPAEEEEQMPDQFTTTGQANQWHSPPSARGKISFKVLDNGKVGLISHARGTLQQTFAKSRNGFVLQNDLKGSAALSFQPLTDLELTQGRLDALSLVTGSGDKQVERIQCGPHRSFDLHPTEPLLAVVEEPATPFTGRSVVIFSPGSKATYGSLLLPYQPSDVCFHKLGGRDVLLVADELNDAIHVVDVRTENFLRYLAPGHPLVVQPTALNVDNRGRLWVACRGGAVLLCQPVSG